MDLNLNGKNVLVTGGSRGIGKGVAEKFMEEGANVTVIGRTSSSLEAIKNERKDVKTIQANLIDLQERERAFQRFLEENSYIDILINNVGGSNGSTIEDTTMSEFEEAMQLNYYSAVHFSKLALPLMKKRQHGSIVNISSIYGRESGGKATYNNSKAAMISFTKALADEAMPYGVRVNSVAPGAILHPDGNWQKRLDAEPERINAFVKREIPGGRFGTIEEVANVVVFLSSDKAYWVSGASLNVDGGQSKMNM
ncbi:SDR family NAD(P)-dependent oxidoreductase [Alteribacillus iranensis]|uniref:SDR family NAD(P)-dependent oxidoreductase n=1 Tax=Alteribacillus iranensis TaxID=930128 RepID=UPI000B82B5EA|nr:SDR family oxidoreductase [Alteribacillus iranensis]